MLLRTFPLKCSGHINKMPFVRYMSVASRRWTEKKSDMVGFIGLGQMGSRMALNLVSSGKSLVVFDVNSSALTAFQDKINGLSGPKQVKERDSTGGFRTASSPAEVALRCSTVITMLPSPSHVNQVYQGGNGILQSLADGALLIDSSTIDPTTARTIAKIAESRSGVDMVDAPVSGGVGGAEAGTLTFMVGGSDRGFSRAESLLHLMGKNIVHCGRSGNGQVAKVANNLVLAISMIAVSEGLNLGTALGMDSRKLSNIFNTSSARCWSSDTYNPCPGVMENTPSSRGYSGGFGVELMNKDLGLAVSASQEAGLDLLLTKSAKDIYQLLTDQGHGKFDFSYVFQLIKNKKFNTTDGPTQLP